MFTLEPGGYRRRNVYWQARSAAEVIALAVPSAQPALQQRAAAISALYGRLSEQYQTAEADNDISLN